MKKKNFFETFTPAVSKDAAQKLRDKIRDICRNGKLLDPEEMAKLINPVVRGWVNYFYRFNPTEARKVLAYVNPTLVRWAKRRYKRFKKSYGKAYRWLAQLAIQQPNMFYHWTIGMKPTI